MSKIVAGYIGPGDLYPKDVAWTISKATEYSLGDNRVLGPSAIQATDPSLTSELVERAIEIIEEYGWFQGTYGNEFNGYCAMGAVNRAFHEKYGIQAFVFEGVYALELINLMDVGPSIPEWNDWPGRTKEEVLDMLTLVAKKLRNEGR